MILIKTILYTCLAIGIYGVISVIAVEFLGGCGEASYTESGDRYYDECVFIPFKPYR